MIAKRYATFLLFAVVALPSGCAGAAEDDQAVPAWASEAAKPDPEYSPPPTPTYKALPGTTPGGTRLRFGEKAVITVGQVGDASRVGVIVTGIERGTPEDKDNMEGHLMPGEQIAEEDDLYLIKAIVINEDGALDADYSGPSLSGVIQDGIPGHIYITSMEPLTTHLSSCTVTNRKPEEWGGSKGARAEVCAVATSPRTVTGAKVESLPGEDDVYWR
ncbi:hypothetical protein [Actinomadura sp. 7K507]|uniref:hypothetical protein n=1 Tax=Actinomadura sp. 7K507 TaxID=2530365 RepID=UPI00104F65E2|nr:hypothetical protein [Actinomadura sp. 7K507]TDC82571.1 hypothetical protein E1285_30480 [Actinomadura sp. 7K507]